MDQIEQNATVDQGKLQESIDQQEADLKAQEQSDALAQMQAQQQEEAGKNNPPGFFQEAGTAIAGGLATAANDLLTLPERVVDMASGEMAEQQATEKGYVPDWNPFNPDQFETKTAWGGILKGLVNYSTLFIPVGGAVSALGKGTGIGVKLAAGAAKGSRVAKFAVNPITKGAVKGAAVDMVLSSSQEENLSAVLRDKFGLDTPLATKDTDHPAMKTFKNIVEGLGMGAIIDGTFHLIKGAAGSLDVVKRNDNIKAQTIEKGKAELQDPAMRGHKNKPIATRTQGNPFSQGAPGDIEKQLDQIDTDYTARGGSTDSAYTPLEAERAASSKGGSESIIKRIGDELYVDENFNRQIKGLASGRLTFEQVSPGAARRFKEIISDGEISDADPMMYVTMAGDKLSAKDIFALDIVVGSSVKQVRDLAMVARETAQYTDLSEADGILKTMQDRMTTAMVALKQAKYKVKVKRSTDDAVYRQTLDDIETSTQDQLGEFFRYLSDNPNSKLNAAFVEAISMSDEIHNLTDFENFLATKLRGGEFGKQDFENLLLKEGQGVMVHSILSSPKTPVRAVMGTTFAGTTRVLSQALGATLRAPLTGDTATAKASIAAVSAMVGAVPEALTLFRSRLKSYWSGELSPRTRFSEYSQADVDWEALGEWTRTKGSAADKAQYNVANLARQMNSNKFLTYSTAVMGATDDAWRLIFARARSREKAIRQVLDMKSNGVDLSPEDIKMIDDLQFSKYHDDNGNIDITKDDFLKSMYKEATMTEDMSGFTKGLEDLFNKHPAVKPFFLFARTGINGVALAMKNMPVVNLALTKQRAILMASADNLDAVRKFGINSAEDLANEKALMIGRQTVATTGVFLAGQMYTSGRLRGNGPADRQQRQLWKDAGWRPNEIKIGDAWISTRALEPYNMMFDLIADIGDNQQTMGEEWSENALLTVSNLVAESIVSKTYLQSLTDLLEFVNGGGSKGGRVAGNMLNNLVPLGGLRADIGRVLNPGMSELNSSMIDTIRNRNRYLPTNLPVKYDILTGKPIQDYDFFTRMWNMFSPVNINFDNSPGRELLFNSNYDTRLSVLSSPTGVSLRDHPEARSLYQKAIGDQNLEAQLNRLSRRKDVQESVAKMKADIAAGRHLDTGKAYKHNILIRQLFTRAKRQAWAKIANDPIIQPLVQENRQTKIDNTRSLQETNQIESLILPIR